MSTLKFLLDSYFFSVFWIDKITAAFPGYLSKISFTLPITGLLISGILISSLFFPWSSLLSEKWDNYCRMVCEDYLSELFGYGKIFERLGIVSDNKELDKKLLQKYGVNEKEILKFISMIGNETHREIFMNVLHNYLNCINIKEQEKMKE